MPKAYPEEFRSDVVALARKREIPWTQIAKDFGISEATDPTPGSDSWNTPGGAAARCDRADRAGL